jgi:hypothetical protein
MRLELDAQGSLACSGAAFPPAAHHLELRVTCTCISLAQRLAQFAGNLLPTIGTDTPTLLSWIHSLGMVRQLVSLFLCICRHFLLFNVVTFLSTRLAHSTPICSFQSSSPAMSYHLAVINVFLTDFPNNNSSKLLEFWCFRS